MWLFEWLGCKIVDLCDSIKAKLSNDNDDDDWTNYGA